VATRLRSSQAANLGHVESDAAAHLEMWHAPLGDQPPDVPGTGPEVLGEFVDADQLG
jgi:hypothetical protein